MVWEEGLFSRLGQGLSRTREALAERLEKVLTGTKPSSEDWEALEEVLLGADFGVHATRALLDSVRESSRVRGRGAVESLRQEIATLLKGRPGIGSGRYAHRPWVVLVVGVNGVGKTTTIGKLACQLHRDGKKVLLAAADTFRAGAIEQLEGWGERVGAEVIKHGRGQDPSGVVFDAVHAARRREADVLLVDTAGRLHNKTNLVEELKKMCRVLGRVHEGAPHETLLVLDAGTGQNAVVQARIFKDAAAVSGIVLTKLDGTARGGVVVRIQQELAIPVEYVGVGEAVDDLQQFDPDSFARAFFA